MGMKGTLLAAATAACLFHPSVASAKHKATPTKGEIIVVQEDISEASRLAMAAGVLGIFQAASFIPLGIMADLFRKMVKCAGECRAPSGGYLTGLSYATSFTIALLSFIPGVLAVRARAISKVSGCPICQVLGWISYGLATAGAVTMIVLASVQHRDTGDKDLEVALGPMTATGIMASLSTTLFAVDGFLIWKKIRALPIMQKKGSATRPVLLPYISGHSGGALVGIGGSF